MHLVRQAVGDLAQTMYLDIVDAYTAKDRRSLARGWSAYLDLIARSGSTARHAARISAWVRGSTMPNAGQQPMRNVGCWSGTARNLITLWGGRDSLLHEYAYRQWSGLIRGFYLNAGSCSWIGWRPRWRKASRFDGEAFERDIRAWEEGGRTRPSRTRINPRESGARRPGSVGQVPRSGPQTVTPDRVSLSTGKPTQCSTALPQFPASLANDGRTRDTNAFWATDVQTDRDPWWQVDLEEPVSIGRVVIVSYYGDERHYGFTVQTSLDGRTWDTVADQRDNQLPSTREGYACEFAPRETRFVRVTLPHNSANTGRHLVEVLVYQR